MVKSLSEMVKPYEGTPKQLLDQAASPGANFEAILAIAAEKIRSTGDENWFMAQAFCLWQLQRFPEAMNALDHADVVCSDDPNFQVLRGVVARQLPDGRGNERAMQAYREAIRLDPERDDAYYCLANLLMDQEHPEAAEPLYRRSLQLNPFQQLAWHNLGRLLSLDERHCEAVPLLRTAVKLNPCHADAWCNLGLAWMGQEEYDRALACFQQSIALDSSHAPTHINMGNAFIGKLEPDKALEYLERGAALESSSANSLWNLSLAYLLLGRFKEGWHYYEARYQTESFEDLVIPTSGPQVRSVDQLPREGDSTLVVWSEQGMGDSIQFFRYLYLLQAMGVPFEFRARPQLLSLFTTWSPFANQLVAQHDVDPALDQRPKVSLMSLPMVFATDLHTVPSSVPYLQAQAPIPEHLRLQQPPGGLSVGLVWASNPDNKSMYKAKSMPVGVLMPTLVQLLDLDLIDLHSLQFGHDAEQLAPWQSHDRIVCWKDRLADFSETAYIIHQLDLVISVDTAVAHLAGALNRPTWLLLPHVADFRWMRHRSDSPWYPSMRLFRQAQKGDWADVAAQLRNAFSEMLLLDLDSMLQS